MPANQVSEKSPLHGLKSNLTVIYGYLQLIETAFNSPSIDRDKIVTLINKAKESTLKLGQDINDIETKQDS